MNADRVLDRDRLSGVIRHLAVKVVNATQAVTPKLEGVGCKERGQAESVRDSSDGTLTPLILAERLGLIRAESAQPVFSYVEGELARVWPRCGGIRHDPVARSSQNQLSSSGTGGCQVGTRDLNVDGIHR